MRWNRLILIIVLASIAFGGSFTCKGHSGDHKDDTVIVTNN